MRRLRECMNACQFDGLGFSAADKRAVVDPRYWCGCGVCRTMCRRQAIRLVDRHSVPAETEMR